MHYYNTIFIWCMDFVYNLNVPDAINFVRMAENIGKLPSHVIEIACSLEIQMFYQNINRHNNKIRFDLLLILIKQSLNV